MYVAALLYLCIMIKYLYCDKGFSEIEEWCEGCWVKVTRPTGEEIDSLQKRFGIPADFLEDIQDIDERPRMEKDGDWVLAILRIPVDNRGQSVVFSTTPVGVMIKGNIVITVCNFSNGILHDFIDHSQKRNIDISSPYDFILRLLDSSAYWFIRYINAIRDESAKAEGKLEQSVRNKDLLQLLQLQKSLVIFSTSLKGNLLLIERLQRLSPETIDHELLEDVDIELRQADTTVEVATAMLDRTLDTYANVISNNVNAIMKRLTSISVILMVPTLIASFYGMNVDIGISMTNHMAFWIIIGIAVVLTGITCLWLRWIKWL